ncbi:MAG: hypothetical protein HC772_17475 [Leptolyngbyaceae cyanobacterium CRU_2_3]|nr:hypothetical protein [Leptolyngbyaceae cyanobacterium CRU_2_3]
MSDVAGGVSTLIDVVSQNAFGAIAKAALDFFVEDLEERSTVYLARVGVDKARVEAICQQDVDTELIDALPKLLAQDLNAAMQQPKAPQRIVLFLDTHEAFWGQQRICRIRCFFSEMSGCGSCCGRWI